MANDPNRDLLPVKEDCSRARQGPGERIDHQSISKLSRCELEDKVHRLLEEQTHLKKLSNNQEEKIKRLGTKLLRLINDKKHGGKNADQSKVSEDLHFQYIELEHENYALKDKITVLRQQLANHSRHNILRSPVRSNHTSPLMSMRQPVSQIQNEFQTTNKTATADVQLQEAEAHIKLLNNEIKALHNKIEYLQQDLEKNSLDNRKTKVTENIEFIRLQRSLKQQAIQIAALQAQIKNSEGSQKILKEELLKAHNENDEALHLIAIKQNEILNLCCKLEEKNLNRLEEDDLKQRISDLLLERDSLKERADLLMKTIEEKSEETEKVKVLKKLLAQEKSKSKKLEEILGINSTYCTNLNCSFKDSSVSENSNVSIDRSIPFNEKKVENGIADTSVSSSKKLLSKSACEKKDGWTTPVCKYLQQECKSVQTEIISSGLLQVKDSEITGDIIERDSAEKIKMELEVQHLREMLRSQTSRCEAQQAEINRLMLELKLNEDKCKSTLQKLDKRLSAFESLEKRSRKEAGGSPRKLSPHRIPNSPFISSSAPRSSHKVEEGVQEGEIISGKVTNIPNEAEKPPKQSVHRDDDSDLEHRFDLQTFQSLGDANSESNVENLESKKRFVDQVFLLTSDEDQPDTAPLKEIPSQKEISLHEDLGINSPSKKLSDRKELRAFRSSKMNVSYSKKHSFSSASSELRLSADLTFQDKKEQKIKVRGIKSSQKRSVTKVLKKYWWDFTCRGRFYMIFIVWLEIDENTSLWNNNMVKLLFIDFTFLDLRGESTETPQSLPKPTVVGKKCEFNFVKEIEITDNRRRILQGLMSKPDLDLIIFKVVSDSEDFDQLTDFECEDVGVGVVTVKEFLKKCNKGLFSIPVKNTEDTKEVIGKLAVSIEITPELFNPKT